MDKGNHATEPKITPDELLNIIGLSPADNLESVNTALAWKSKLIGSQVRGLFGYQRILDSISKDINVFGPWAVAAAWQSAFWISSSGRLKPARVLRLAHPEILMR